MLKSRARISALAAVISLFLFSCAAKRAAVRLTVRVPEEFVGKIRIDGCRTAAAPDEIVIDRTGHGETSVCSASPDLRLVVIRGGRAIEVPAKLVETGDHLVMEIDAELTGAEK